MFQSILGYLFLFIFALTAILSILSLPNWIKIPEWYRKKLFVALLLEVVGAIIMMFNQSFLGSDQDGTSHQLSENRFLVLNEAGLVIQPSIQIDAVDTSYAFTFGNMSFDALPKLECYLTEESMIVRSSNNVDLGEVSHEMLKHVGIFNTIKTAKGEVSSSHNYTLVKWKKNEETENKWVNRGSYLEDSPFHLKVYDDNNETKYQIFETSSKKVIFSSDASAKQLFDVDNRIIHFFE